VSEADIRSILEESKTIAVVGLSPREERDSHRVAKYPQGQGYRIIPVTPNAEDGSVRDPGPTK
jgi:predicted CoA-binding protein